jgi:hypothetical protein
MNVMYGIPFLWQAAPCPYPCESYAAPVMPEPADMLTRCRQRLREVEATLAVRDDLKAEADALRKMIEVLEAQRNAP